MMVDEDEELGVKDFGAIPKEWQADMNRIARAGFDYQRFSHYHFRIEGCVDFWPTTRKWYVPVLDVQHPYLRIKGYGHESLIDMVRKIEEYL